jgi:transposase
MQDKKVRASKGCQRKIAAAKLIKTYYECNTISEAAKKLGLRKSVLTSRVHQIRRGMKESGFKMPRKKRAAKTYAQKSAKFTEKDRQEILRFFGQDAQQPSPLPPAQGLEKF